MRRRLVYVRLQLDQRTLDRAIRNSGASRIFLDLYVVIGMLSNDEIGFGPAELRSDSIDSPFNQEASDVALKA